MRGALVICVLVVVFVVTSCIGGCAIERDPWIHQVDRPINTGSFAWWEQIKKGE